MTETFKNPILPFGADPFVTFWKGKYYYVYSVKDAKIEVSSADNIHHLNQNGKCIFHPEAGKEYSYHLWAPEIHEINGDWYLYVACDDGDMAKHRMYVLKSKNGEPDGDYEMIGRITPENEYPAIDGTVLKKGNDLYFLWSGWEEGATAYIPHDQCIFMAKMKSPTELEGERILLSKPNFDWERHGSGPAPNGRVHPSVNEGPQVLYKDDTIHVIYSASHSRTRYYCFGLLTYRGGDIMDKNSWVKSDKPVFVESEGSHGPGHGMCIKALDGKTDFVVYHAKSTPAEGWSTRGVRAQPFTWDGDMPVFGKAVTPLEEVEIPV